jgi:uncharacterized membrane protein
VNKRTLIAGFIVLAIGIALDSGADQIISSSLRRSPPLVLREFAIASIIIGGIVAFAGVILIIYGFVLPDPPVHWDNDL